MAWAKETHQEKVHFIFRTLLVAKRSKDLVQEFDIGYEKAKSDVIKLVEDIRRKANER